jgi:formylglycine-generating enzyme required for sulfatase activity
MTCEAVLTHCLAPGWQFEGVETFSCGGQSHEIGTFLLPDLGMRFRLTPGGDCMIGSPPNEQGRYTDEGPQFPYRAGPMLVGVTPVTQAQWVAGGGVTQSRFRGDGRPVEMVSWNDVADWLAALPHDLTLPTEAEWEYCCRAGTQTRFCFGDDAAELGDYAWYEANSGNQTHPVGEKKPNAFGLYDAHGNVWEWTCDIYQDNYAKYLIEAAEQMKEAREEWPINVKKDRLAKPPSNASLRVYRGGGWFGSAEVCRSAFRDRFVPAYRSAILGFRAVVVLRRKK